jgi:mannose-1-phosphate guanylyltransferase/mannose-6-phosphate isomerase
VSFFDEKTLFQSAALRMTGPQFRPPLVVSNSDFRFIVAEQLQEVGIDPETILIEPESRNTGPAILAAALYLSNDDPDAVMLVSPSDHVISDVNAFHSAVEQGLPAVDKALLVTFGIRPTHAETAYGYLEIPEITNGQLAPLKRFVEKPDVNLATQMLKTGSFLWNSGIFLFSAKDIISAFQNHHPSLFSAVALAVRTSSVDLGFYRLGAKAWAEAEDISIDYSVMEKASNLMVVPFDGGWSDLGGWDALWRASQKDENGVHTSGEVVAINCSDSLIRSESEQVAVIGIGLDNIIVVGMNDAVLVADMSRAQDVKTAVNLLKARNVPQAITLPKDHRPWGWFESLAIGPRFQVKRIHVHAGASLSLQRHHHRAEHWIVVSGTAEVTLNGAAQLLSENESIYIPLGAIHRISNPGKVPMVLIEVQTGAYLGEDDIVRYEDNYARGSGARG